MRRTSLGVLLIALAAAMPAQIDNAASSLVPTIKAMSVSPSAKALETTSPTSDDGVIG